MRSLYDRWIEKVAVPEDESKCWIWCGAVKNKAPNLYGHLGRGRKESGNIAAHRFSYEHFHGPIPEGMQVQHLCHVSLCVNPDHLKLGFPRENTQDMIKAGRARFRENLPRGSRRRVREPA